MASSNTLVMVSSFFRNGDRTPLYIAENSPYKNVWPTGAATLTEKGKRQACELGKAYRNRYKDFLTLDNITREIFFFSTQTKRSTKTMVYVKSELFRDIEHTEGYQSFPSTLVPIVYIDQDEDPLYPEYRYIIRPENLYNDAKKYYPELHVMYKKRKEEWLGWLYLTAKNNRSDLFRVLYEIDEIRIKNTLIPQGYKLVYRLPSNAFLLDAYDMYAESLTVLANVHPYYIEQGCELLTVVQRSTTGFIKGQHKMKLALYSVHDVTIRCLLGQLMVDLPSTDFCGSVTFELHQLADEKYYIKVRHCLNCESEPYDVPLDGELFYSMEMFDELVFCTQLNVTLKTVFDL
ncbi:hypothetical protein CHUAL_013313 [Chamberlinius hualienensis]